MTAAERTALKAESGLALLEQMLGSDSEMRDALQMDTKHAMLAGCGERLRQPELAERFWRGKSQREVDNLLTRVRSVEPCSELTAAVAESARVALIRGWILREAKIEGLGAS